MRLIGLVLALGLTLAPHAGEAQQPAKVPRIGVLTPTFASGYGQFHQGLRELGYVEGKNLAIEQRQGREGIGPDDSTIAAAASGSSDRLARAGPRALTVKLSGRVDP